MQRVFYKYAFLNVWIGLVQNILFMDFFEYFFAGILLYLLIGTWRQFFSRVGGQFFEMGKSKQCTRNLYRSVWGELSAVWKLAISVFHRRLARLKRSSISSVRSVVLIFPFQKITPSLMGSSVVKIRCPLSSLLGCLDIFLEYKYLNNKPDFIFGRSCLLRILPHGTQETSSCSQEGRPEAPPL